MKPESRLLRGPATQNNNPHLPSKFPIPADEATIAKSLPGHWRKDHIFELPQALELYRFYQDNIPECDRSNRN